MNGRLWPMHVKPRCGELLSSWFARVAHGHGLDCRDFHRLIWPKIAKTDRDIDRLVDSEMIRTLAAKCGVSVQRAEETSMRQYQGLLFESFERHGWLPWVVPYAKNQTTRNTSGLQFCASCLATDQIPYFRRTWRLALSTCCVTHGLVLQDCCPKCGKAVLPHLMGRWTNNMVPCWHCGGNLVHYSHEPEEATSDEITSQRFMLSALDSGWIELYRGAPVHAYLYFYGFHSLVRLIGFRKDSYQILRALIGHSAPGNLDRLHIYQRHFEFCRIQRRRYLLFAAWWLTREWPQRLLKYCEVTGVHADDLKRHDTRLPYWIERVLDANCSNRRYEETDTEIRNSAEFLERFGIPKTTGNIYALLGKQVPRDCHQKLQRAFKESSFGTPPHT